nr:nuclease-related domain-containing protein [Neobacillus sp. Marseille-Q6967]
MAKRRAGHWGEIVLNIYLKELPADKYYIFHDLQLNINGTYFQIDFLLLSTIYHLIIEAKNISGTLTFDKDFKQLIRLEDGEVFEDPRIQANRNQNLLKRFLISHGLHFAPIEQTVFFSNVKTKLQAAPGNQTDFSRVCKAREIFQKIHHFESIYHQEKLKHSQIENLCDLFLSQHSPLTINILKEFDIAQDAIRTGVCCPSCSCLPMVYVKGKWVCLVCHKISRDAFIEGVHDYFYLIKPTITNQEFKEFFHIPNGNIAQKKLAKSGLNFSGKNKGRIYFK